jgi:hypothetical protein
LNAFQARVGQVETDDLVSAAVASTVRKVTRRLDLHGAVPIVAGGFPRYCDTVLLNEVRRFLGRRAKKRARRMFPGEVAYVDVVTGSRSTVPASGVEVLRAEVVYSVRAWDRAVVARQERELGVATLEIGAKGQACRLFLSGDPARREMLEPTLDRTWLRVENTSVAALHVSVRIAAYWDDNEWIELRTPLLVLDTSKGIGLDYGEAVFIRKEPIEPEEEKVNARSGPRQVAVRQFQPCQWEQASEGNAIEEIKASILNRLAPPQLAHSRAPRTRRVAWLAPDNVASLAMSVWQQTDLSDQPTLLCRLAEWHSPGLHRPHRPGHPGGHPLEARIRAAVEALQAAEGRPRDSNAASQARCRMVQRVRLLLASAASGLHADLESERSRTQALGAASR